MPTFRPSPRRRRRTSATPRSPEPAATREGLLDDIEGVAEFPELDHAAVGEPHEGGECTFIVRPVERCTNELRISAAESLGETQPSSAAAIAPHSVSSAPVATALPAVRYQ